MQQPGDPFPRSDRHYGRPVPLPPSLSRYPVPTGSRMSPVQWAEANDHWRVKRIHPHGVAEDFAWGTVLWATNGHGPLGVLLAEPGQPVGLAHRIAAEVTATHIPTKLTPTRTMSRRGAWSGAAAAVPTIAVFNSVDLVSPLTLPAAVAAAVATAIGVGRRRRLRTPRTAWRHVFDPPGAGACLPHLRWLTDLTEQVPDQGPLVWQGVREILWTAPSLRDAGDPLAQVSVALARTARARHQADVAAMGELPPADPDPRVSRMGDIASSLVDSLGFEEEVYRQMSDELGGVDEGPAPGAGPAEPDDPGRPPRG